MEKRYIIRQYQIDLLHTIVTRSTEIIPNLTVGDYSNIAKALQNLPELCLEEEKKSECEVDTKEVLNNAE